MTVSYDPEKISARFAAKVCLDGSGCWIWRGVRTDSGYGEVKFQRKRIRAHRMSWRLFRGEIPSGMFVLHNCDVRSCVNPSHLWLGTKSDNSKDAMTKGRMRNIMKPGEGNASRKLSERDFPIMREMRKKGMTYKAIAEYIGLGETTIYSALNGISWRAFHEQPVSSGGTNRL